ncbi:hypothetical protein CANARDRAFT_195349 [[Candida] arabinofermentans NRRL YB-2248]|uniref:TLC domain-containing protein n=1 Tax=[Candida] arabinofermentans NRRL YB-2248 TaxID=983967 RepID=A0A1E4T534_9ASCO|nr:hypothetical protein CANARDRAFT_195349 [[Candida] arabinofermentans NRRL YB-2248]
MTASSINKNETSVHSRKKSPLITSESTSTSTSEKNEIVSLNSDTINEYDLIYQSEKVDRYQITIALILDLIIILSSFQYPFFEKFYKLQYNYSGTNYYDIGYDDIYLSLFIIINLSLIRSSIMIFILRPIAILFKIHNLKPIQRFKEQGWLLIYYSISWIFGFYLYLNSDYFLNNDKVYLNWPHNQLSMLFKLYYLIQTSLYIQLTFVINIEEKRKDYIQMFSHHIITSILCICSYSYYMTHIGHVILLLMDIVDVFLSLAKILKYIGCNFICDLMFLIFMLSWIILRHGVYNFVLYHTYQNASRLMGGSCELALKLNLNLNNCYPDLLFNILVFLLFGLQIITIIWLFMILKVAYKVIKGDNADDVRSDDDDM